MSSHHCSSPLSYCLLILLLLQAEAQWMNNDNSQKISNDRVNPWQSPDSGTNSRRRTSRLRLQTGTDNTTDIIDTTFRGQDASYYVTQESFVGLETEDTQFHVNNITSMREMKPIARTSKVESNTPSFGQGRARWDDSLPPVPVGPFNNPLGPESIPFEATTRSWSRPLTGHAPGSLAPSVPQVLAPAPPFGPPAPPTTTRPFPPGVGGGPGGQAGTGVKPPAIPIDGLSPGPPTTDGETQITDIQCRNNGGIESFSAVLALPSGFEAVPVFEDAPTVDATTNPSCRMIPTQLVGMFQLFVVNYKQCGVTQCRQSGSERILCLVLRFPLMTGIKLPEDTIIEIRCRPQEKTAEDNSIVKVATSKNADRIPLDKGNSPSVFEGGGSQFESKLDIFTKFRGTEQFNRKIAENEEVDLGEEIQLRSEVKSGDGWEYSRMTEVVIQRVGGSRTRSSFNTAVLVFSDGCRNPEFKVIAKSHPQRDSNGLVVNFNLRVFMFQDMVPGDSLMISAKVIGCVEKEDCEPVNCADDNNNGFGRRKKRSTSEMTLTKEIEASEVLSLSPPPGTRSKRSMEDLNFIQHGSTIDWDRRFGIKVRFPEGNSSPLVQESLEALECRSYLFITMGVATFFCFVTFIFAMVLFYRSRPKVIPSEMPVQMINRDIKSSALSASVSKKVLLNEHHVGEASIPSLDTGTIESLEINLSQPLYENNSAVVSPVRQRTREVEHNVNNIHGINSLSQNEDEENYFYPKENVISVARRPSAVIKINNDEQDKSTRNTSIKRQPSTVIRINDNETHTTIHNQKPTPKPRLSKETN